LSLLYRLVTKWQWANLCALTIHAGVHFLNASDLKYALSVLTEYYELLRFLVEHQTPILSLKLEAL